MAAIRRTKLVCTLGPASVGLVPELVAAGMDVARVNLSHGTEQEHKASVAAVRAASVAARRAVGILVDLPGPKIRLGALTGGSIELEAGDRFTLLPGSNTSGDENGVGVTYPRLAHDVRAGDRILLADGAAELRVTAADGDRVHTEVVRGGVVRSGGGVAIPADRLTEPALTERDLAALPHVRALGADFIGQSFVRPAADIVALRERLGPSGPRIVAKIETRPAVEDFDAIVDVADAVMIARGDLGVELPFEEVPLVQKQLVRRALDRGVPSIVATQMLESMTSSPRPTRAEASDVANAVFDGADAIMLSGETAIGAYPVLAAQAAAGIALACERRGANLLPRGGRTSRHADGDALAAAAIALADADPRIVAIACFTRTGRTALAVSTLRPMVPVIAFAADASTLGALTLADGVVPRACPDPGADIVSIASVTAWVERTGLLGAGQRVVVVVSSGRPGTPGDVLAVVAIGEELRAPRID